MRRKFLSKSTALWLVTGSVLCLLCGRAFAEKGDKLNQTASFQNNPKIALIDWLNRLGKSRKIYFVYPPELVKGKWISSDQAKKTTTSEIAEILAERGLHLKRTSDTQFIIEQISDVPNQLASPPLVEARQERIRGLVKDLQGQPLPGVSVRLVGMQRGTLTNDQGVFELEAKPGDKLEFSYVGFLNKTLVVGAEKSIEINLESSSNSLEEVVVVGYGTQKKADLTGAIGTVNVEKSMRSRPVTNVQEMLAGTVPGLNVTKGSGAVGSGASINIRGTSTIGGSSGVLVLIDGVPGNMSTLNPNDIESISTLKDAASASIYGSRAANGVLLITTKKGSKSGKPTIEVNTSVGIQNPQLMLDFVGAEDFMKLWDEALVNDGKQPLYGERGLADLHAGKYADVKWYKEIYKKNALINNNNVAISGSEKAVEYRFSASHDYQDGTLPNNDYNRIIIRPDLNIKLSDKLSTRANIQYTETYIKTPQGGTEIWQTQAARIAPIYPIRNQYGEYGAGSAMANNPIAGATAGGFTKEKHKEMLAIFDITYRPIENLNIIGTFSRYTHDSWKKDRVLTYELFDEDGAVASTQNLIPNLRDRFENGYRNMLQFTADYALMRDKHSFKVLAGFSQEYFKGDSISAFRDQLPFSNIHVLNTGSQANMQNTGTESDVAIRSFFGRLNYDFDGKYLFQANIRADGSSRFARGHRWGIFPSFSAGWNINREAFMKDLDWISQLKLRGSWGILGDAEKVGYYATAAVLTYNPSMYGFNGVVAPGAYNYVAINPNISWEEAKQTNIGLDMSFLNQRISLSADYFINNRDKILYRPPAPTEFGLPAPISNLLKVQNRGFEFLAGYQDRKGDFNWGIDFNFNYAKNEVKDLAGTGPWIVEKGLTNVVFSEVGNQFELPYGLEAIGLFQHEEEIAASPSQGPNVFPGNIRYRDVNGDNVIDGNDRVILNDKPVIRFGGNINFGWKQLDVSANFYGALQNYRYIQSYEGWAFFLSQNARPMHLDRWTPENPDASYPRLTIQYTANDTRYSDYWLRKADYLKIQNVQIGFTFPTALIQKLKINYLRAYVSAQNLSTITNYPGFDPEGNYYPLSRTFSVGVNLKF